MEWIISPDNNTLSKKEAWIKKGKNEYIAQRHYFLLVTTESSGGINGPMLDEAMLPTGSKYVKVIKITKSNKYSHAIEQTITSSVSSKLSTELASRIGTDFKAGTKLLGSEIKQELETKVSSEFTTGLQDAVKNAETFEHLETYEDTVNIELTIPKSHTDSELRKLIVYMKLREKHITVYWHKTELIKLIYQKNWLWSDTRKTLENQTIIINEPLFRITYYEPLNTESYAFDNYTPQVADAKELLTADPVTSYPANRSKSADKDLETLAKLAFPVTREEKKIVKKKAAATKKTYSPGRPLALSPNASAKAASKKAAKKAALKKAAIKKAVPKKAARKAAPKKVARKAPPKKGR